MTRSLFSRLVAVYLIIIFLLFITLGFTVISAYREQGVVTRRAALFEHAEVIGWALLYKNESTRNAIMAMVSKDYDASIWIVYPDRTMISFAEEIGKDVINERGNYLSKELAGTFINNALGGQSVYHTGSDATGGIMTVGMPILDEEENIYAAVFIHSRIPPISSFVQQINLRLWLPVFAAVIVGLILVLWLNYRISSPLAQMNSIAKKIARGRFEQRIKNTRACTEIKQLAESFNSMAEDLAALDKQRKEFIAGITHELRSPLTSIHGFIAGILDGTVPQQEREHYLHIVLDETRRLKKLINDLLDISYYESGKAQLTITDFNLNELILRVLASMETDITAKALKVKLHFEQERAMVFADRDRIEQVLRNLLDNAVKFSDNGQYIRVYTRAEADFIRAEIKDYGSGIPKEELEHIWDMFHTLNRSRSPGVGTGLGLPIARGIIEQHGGKISVSTDTGKGCVFSFTLPKADK